MIPLLFVALFAACSDNTTTPTPVQNNFDVNVAPLSSGSWYRPSTNTSWQWQLTETINTNYDVAIYDIDLFESNVSTIEELHTQGKKVICYFSGGSYESWRPDATAFSSELLGNDLDGWEGEWWLDISNEKLIPLMRSRLDLALQKGCDGVEPDNMDGHINNSGFTLSADDQLAYNKFMANEAHLRGLAIALKNDLNQIVALEPYFDMSVNEQCHQYSECDLLLPFIEHQKPVLIAEYDSSYKTSDTSVRDFMCNESNRQQFKTLILALDLDDSYRDSCF